MIKTLKPMNFSTRIHCTLWTNQESRTKKAVKSQIYFNQVVRDCISNLKKGNVAYCFSHEQLEEIKNKLKKVCNVKHEYNEEDGVYYLRSDIKWMN